MIFEGRRWWPRRAAAILSGLERRRLLKILRTMRHHDEMLRKLRDVEPASEIKRHASEFATQTRREAVARNSITRNGRTESSRLFLEAAARLNDFPVDPKTVMSSVVYPTRLGNLIAAYEQYPLLKYRLDAVFFWPRIWVSIDRDLREEIDNQQALVDGALYMVSALAVGACAFPLYAIIDAFWPTTLMYSERPWADLIAAVACALGSYTLYSVSLHAHSKFGDLFKAVFDQHQAKIELSGIVEFVANAAGDPALMSRSDLERNRAAYRFLRWQRIRRPNEKRNRRVRT